MGPNDRDGPCFTIGIAAGMLRLHPQTLRLYERLGFIIPHRTRGKTRLYSRKNIQQVRFITTLTRRHGVNLAGVGMILKIQQQMRALRRESQDLMESLKEAIGDPIGRGTGPRERSSKKRARSPAVKIKIERE